MEEMQMGNGAISAPPVKRWHKKWWGVMLLGVLVFVGIFLIVFVVQTARFYIQIKQGKLLPKNQLAANISSQTTVDPTVKARSVPAKADVLTADDPVFGLETAPLTIVEFADFECPFSASAHGVLRRLAAKYSDRVKFQFRDFPIVSKHEHALKAAEAGECANAQGNFWAMHDKMFQNQSDLSDDALKKYAAEAGLDGAAFKTCLESGVMEKEVAQDYRDGLAAGVNSTPTFFVNGYRVAGVIPENVWEEMMRKAGM
ncbi:MAG: hypothetical protein HW383_472 [Candidatus Magasanikbacteria bacterium]|nr:hypothetical protein [Candidatus Magasanikbacteria bacterium]